MKFAATILAALAVVYAVQTAEAACNVAEATQATIVLAKCAFAENTTTTTMCACHAPFVASIASANCTTEPMFAALNVFGDTPCSADLDGDEGCADTAITCIRESLTAYASSDTSVCPEVKPSDCLTTAQACTSHNITALIQGAMAIESLLCIERECAPLKQSKCVAAHALEDPSEAQLCECSEAFGECLFSGDAENHAFADSFNEANHETCKAHHDHGSDDESGAAALAIVSSFAFAAVLPMLM